MGIDIGVDEAGRGPAIGPLVVCALSVPTEDREILEEIGVDDSKKIGKKERERVFRKISGLRESRGWGLGIVVCKPARIDEWMENGTLNSLEVELFSEAINRADRPTSSTRLVLDACDVDPIRFGTNVLSALGSSWNCCEIVSEHKMDSSDIVVGAASIVAKITRDLEIEKLSEEIGIDLGSGYPSDRKTVLAIEVLCQSDEPHEALRWKWANVRNSWTKTNNKTMPKRKSENEINKQTYLSDWE